MSSDNIVTWYGPQFTSLVNTEAARRLNRATALLHERVIKNISKPTRTLGPSLPGNFPHADTGKLRQSIYMELATPSNLEGRVGSRLKYAGWLEHGTNKMAARSYLRRTLREMQPRIRRILLRGY